MKNQNFFRVLSLVCFFSIIFISCDKSDDTNDNDKIYDLSFLENATQIQSGFWLDFGSVEIGTTLQKTYFIKNENEVELGFRVDNWDILWDQGFNLKIGNNEEGNTIMLSPGTTKELTVMFSPTTMGYKNSVLSFVGDHIVSWDLNLKGEGFFEPIAITPPLWIQGEWKNGELIVYNFAADNVTSFSNGTLIFDVKTQNGTFASQGLQNTGYSDGIYGDKYEVYLKQNGVLQMTLTFVKVTATTLNYTLNGNTVVLTKQ